MRGITLTLCLFAILAAVASGLLYSMIGTRKQELELQSKDLQVALASSQAALTDAESRNESATARLGELERQLSELRARNVTLEARNSQLARDVTSMRQELSLRENADAAAATDAAALRKELVETKAALAAATAVASSEAVASATKRIEDLEAEVAFLRQTGGGRSLAEALAAVPEDLSATVLEVRDAGKSVVLNIGLRSGAVPSLELVLRRGSTIVARVRLTDVRDSYSVAEVLPSSGSGAIRAGDRASRS
jgi:hypothetical protein